MNELGLYRDENGLTDEDVANTLSALLGKRISGQGVKLKSGKGKVPRAWAEALGLSSLGEETGSYGSGISGDDPLTSPLGDIPMRDSDSPRAPAGAKYSPTAASSSGDYSVVRDRIAKAYGAIGAGASMVTGNDGFGHVTNAYSNDLAQAWINAAKQSKNVAKIVEFMESGGPVGELVVAHIILVMGWVYVSGRGPGLDFLYADKFGSYRRTAEAQREKQYAEQQAAAGFDGGYAEGSAYPVGDFAGETS